MRIPRAAATTLAAVAATAVLAPASYADDCPNAEIRAKQTAAGLGDCRAYELVSPVDKSGVPVDFRGTSMSSPDGDAIVYAATGGFAGSETSVYNTHYVGRRGGSGWSTDPIEPLQLNLSNAVGFPTVFLSDDLKSTIQVSGAALAPGAIEGGSNLYRRDNLSGARTLLGAGTGNDLMFNFADPGRYLSVGATPDLSHFVFATRTQLLPEAPPNELSVYEAVGDDLRLVNRLPDGSISTAGAGVGLGLGNRSDSAVSVDGRRVFFQAGDPNWPNLYMRQDGTTTVPISVSKRPGDPADPVSAVFGGASDDGSVVYFTSDYPLTPDASPTIGNLYRYDVEADTLVNVTPLTHPDDLFVATSRFYDVASDGSAAYFLAQAALTPGASPNVPHIYRHDQDGVQLVAELPFVQSGGPNGIAISDNMRYVAIETYASLTGFDSADPGCHPDVGAESQPDGQCQEVFVYDAVERELVCATCTVPDARNRHSTLGHQWRLHSMYTPRSMLDDGTVLITTSEALVPNDVNGRSDVYAWRDGVPRLVSSGRAPADATFADASPDGRDVFFISDERMVASDTDAALDLYDARIGGGLADQNRVQPDGECTGDACQGAARSPREADRPASIRAGGGNVAGSQRLARLRVLGARQSGRAVRLRLAAPARGTIVVTGKRVRRARRSTARRGGYSLSVGLTRAGRRQLARSGRLRVALRVRFDSASGGSSTRTVAVTLAKGRGR